MPVPVQITFHNVEPSAALEETIRSKVDKLGTFHDAMTWCHVTVESPHQHRRSGNTFEVRIDIGIPGGEVVVNRDPGDVNAHQDPYVAVRDAFNAARRMLDQREAQRRSARRAG